MDQNLQGLPVPFLLRHSLASRNFPGAQSLPIPAVPVAQSCIPKHKTEDIRVRCRSRGLPSLTVVHHRPPMALNPEKRASLHLVAQSNRAQGSMSVIFLAVKGFPTLFSSLLIQLASVGWAYSLCESRGDQRQGEDSSEGDRCRDKSVSTLAHAKCALTIGVFVETDLAKCYQTHPKASVGLCLLAYHHTLPCLHIFILYRVLPASRRSSIHHISISPHASRNPFDRILAIAFSSVILLPVQCLPPRSPKTVHLPSHRASAGKRTIAPDVYACGRTWIRCCKGYVYEVVEGSAPAYCRPNFEGLPTILSHLC